MLHYPSTCILRAVGEMGQLLTCISSQFRQKYALAWNESMFSADRDGTTGNSAGICMDQLAICDVREDDMVADALRSISYRVVRGQRHYTGSHASSSQLPYRGTIKTPIAIEQQIPTR